MAPLKAVSEVSWPNKKKSVVNHAVALVKYKEIEGVSLQSSEATPLSYFYLHSAVCEMLSRLFSCER